MQVGADRSNGFGERGCPGGEPDNFAPGKPFRAEEVRPEWFSGTEIVGLTAGTSTLPETVAAVHARLLRSPAKDT